MGHSIRRAATDMTWSSCQDCSRISTACASSPISSAAAAPPLSRAEASAPRSLNSPRRFFDVVCAGGVDSVPARRGRLSPGIAQADLSIAGRCRFRPIASTTALFAKSGINPFFHLMESSRGCRFKCNFCVIPAEVGTHARYDLATLAAGIDNAVSTQSAIRASAAGIRCSYCPGQQLLGRPRTYARGRRDAGIASTSARLERARHPECPARP